MNHIKYALFAALLCCGLTAIRAEDAKTLLTEEPFDIQKASEAYKARNYARARDLYLKGAEAGNARAQAMLCVIYMSDDEVFPVETAAPEPKGPGGNYPDDEDAIQKTVRRKVAAKYAEALKYGKNKKFNPS